jgi:hypothetical protein
MFMLDTNTDLSTIAIAIISLIGIGILLIGLLPLLGLRLVEIINSPVHAPRSRFCFSRQG